MGQFLWAYIIFSCISVSQFSGRIQNTGEVFSESSFEGKQSIISTNSAWYNDEANKENCQQSGPRLFSTKQNFLNEKVLTGKASELNRTSKIINYIFVSEYHIKRLDGIDIIHPFNYFW